MLSTDTTWEVVQSFLNVPGMKGVALIDGRSRPYFQGIERVLNSQQREALAQGVWQVLETIPDDFESFEFQFAGTQVYIHKLSQEQILLVLTHDNLIYPDYFDAFSRLRGAFSQDNIATMDAFQRLLGARNTQVTPLNLSDVANDWDDAPSPVETLGSDGGGLDDSGDLSSEEPPTLEIPTLEIPSGSADYAVAADTEITDISTAAVAPDAPANPGRPDDDLPTTVLLDADDPLDDAPGLPDFAGTNAGLPDLGGPEVAAPDAAMPEVAMPEVVTTDADAQAENAAAQFAASLADANALVGRRSVPSDRAKSSTAASDEELGQAVDLPSLDGDDLPSVSLPEVDSLLAVTQPPATPKSDAAASRSNSRSNSSQADLAALMDTLSLGEEDFESQSGEGPVADESAVVSGEAEAADASLPDMELAGEADGHPGTVTELPDVEAEAAGANPWDETGSAFEAGQSSPSGPEVDSSDEPLLAVTQPASALGHDVAGRGDSGRRDDAAERSLHNQLDAVALDEGIDIEDLDDLFGYEEPVAEQTAPQIPKVVLESYVESLNALGEFSAHYLGRAVIVNYWRTSRPADEWLQGAFAIERSANSIRLGPDYAASRRSPITEGQQAALQTWAGEFVSRCSKVIRDFPQLAQQSLSEDQSKMLDL